MKVTIFWKTEFFGNIGHAEVNLVEHGTSQYAQYNNSPFVKFKKKGGRNVYGIRQTYQPFIAIVEGWGLGIKPNDMTKVVSETADVVVKQSQYMSFDDRFVTDFEALLAKQNVNVIAVYK